MTGCQIMMVSDRILITGSLKMVKTCVEHEVGLKPNQLIFIYDTYLGKNSI